MPGCSAKWLPAHAGGAQNKLFAALFSLQTMLRRMNSAAQSRKA